MLGWEFPPHNSGGLGTACLGLTQALASQDVDLTFVLPRKIEVKDPKVKFLFADDERFKVKLKFIDSPIRPYVTSSEYESENSLNKNSIYGRNLLEEVERYSQEVGRIAKDEDFDIIHAHDWMAFKAGLLAKKMSGKPLIVHIHSTEIDRTGGLNNINQEIFAIEKEAMEQADQVIAVSKLTKKMIVDFYRIPSGKIEVVHNGINIDDYSGYFEETVFVHQLKEQGNKVVLFVGRLTIQKGVDYFLKAAKRVLEFYPKAIFVIVGSGDMERQIIREVAVLGISDKVFFVGFLRGKELIDMYRLADLFVMPSVSEPFGLTALESVVNGTPVLLSKQSGVSEVLRHSLTVDFWDTESMANKILAVLNYGSLQMTLKLNAGEQVKQVNWQATALKCISIYREVLDSYFKN